MPGAEVRRAYGFTADIQHSFYLGYFLGYGNKVQTASLLNGMITSVYLDSYCFMSHNKDITINIHN